MKIAIFGTIVYDTVIHYDRQAHNGFGGITFNTLAFGKLSQNTTSLIYPVSYIGEDRISEFVNLAKIYPNIKTEGLFLVNMPTANSYLVYSSPYERTETLICDYPPLTYQQISSFTNFDVILINFISGNDITLAALRRLRKHSKALFYMDLHCITMARDPKGAKAYRYLPVWREWVACADIVQMNALEIQSLFKEKVDFFALDRYVRDILEAGPKIGIITLGKDGVFIGYRSNGSYNFRYGPALTSGVIDPTGCGDVFSAAFIIKYKATHNPLAAVTFANKMAGENGKFYGVEWLLTLDT